jgi:Sulfotransferase domain
VSTSASPEAAAARPRLPVRRFLAHLLLRYGGRRVLLGFRVVRRSLSWRNIRAQRRADVLLMSYKKSGRTWLTMMLSRCLASHAGLTEVDYLAKDLIGGSVAGLPHIRISHDDNPHWKTAASLARSKRHYRDKKVILLVRDPRDVIVSLYFQRSRREQAYGGTLSDFLHGRRVRAHLDEPEGSLDTILEYYNIWARQRSQPRDFCLVRYEDLKADTAGELKRILRFAGVDPVIDAHVQEAVQFGSFENMRALEAGDALKNKRLRAGDPKDKESFKTRKGKVGGYTDYLSPEDIAWMERKIAETLDPIFGYGEPPHVRAARRSPQAGAADRKAGGSATPGGLQADARV